MAQEVQERLAGVLQNSEFERIAPIMDDAELQSSNPNVLLDWPHALHLLGHIYNHHLEDARFLWKRIPAEAKQNNPELEATWRLLQYLWNQQYHGLWEALTGFHWSAQVQPVIEALIIKKREGMLSLLQQAYSHITPGQVASLLGVNEADATSLTLAKGWEVDAESGTLVVPHKAADQGTLDGFTNLQRLTEYMLHMEQ